MPARYRKQGSLNYGGYKRVYRYTNGTIYSQTYQPSANPTAGAVDEISDFVTPNFRKRKNDGEVIMSAVDLIKERVSSSKDFMKWSWTQGAEPHSFEVDGDFVAHGSVLATRPAWYNTRVTDAKSSVLVDAAAKVASEEIQSLVTIAEAHKAAAMMAKPFAAAREILGKISSLKTLRRYGLKDGILPFSVDMHSLSVAIRNSWLEYRFGWKPLLYDIENAEEAFFKNVLWEPKVRRLVARSSHKVEWETNDVYTPRWGGTDKFSRKVNHSTKVSAGILYELSDLDVVDAAKRHMGVRLADVPASIWEVVPYSFVLDRFVNVGNWLKAIMPKPGVTIRGRWITTRENIKEQHSAVSVSGGYYLTPEFKSGGEWLYTKSRLTRMANPELPLIPAPNPRPLSLVQQIDHAALILNELYGLRQKGLR